DILRLPYLASTYSYQVIWPAELPRAAPITTCGDFDTHDSGHRMFKSFGWSLSAGIDLDGNHAPDLIAGDFDSDQLRDVSQVLPFPYCPNVSISVGKSKLLTWIIHVVKENLTLNIFNRISAEPCEQRARLPRLGD
ncbi:hypothetical protein T265_15781, partial [Opisthorchis viverrini]